MTKDGNLFQWPRTVAKGKEQVERLRSVSVGHLERIQSGHLEEGRANVIWYVQEQEEWVCLLSGEACLRFDDENGSVTDVRLVAGDMITIPARRRHCVLWTSKEICHWLALFCDNQEAASDE